VIRPSPAKTALVAVASARESGTASLPGGANGLLKATSRRQFVELTVVLHQPQPDLFDIPLARESSRHLPVPQNR
jgi:hypothetical protein